MAAFLIFAGRCRIHFGGGWITSSAGGIVTQGAAGPEGVVVATSNIPTTIAPTGSGRPEGSKQRASMRHCPGQDR